MVLTPNDEVREIMAIQVSNHCFMMISVAVRVITSKMDLDLTPKTQKIKLLDRNKCEFYYKDKT